MRNRYRVTSVLLVLPMTCANVQQQSLDPVGKWLSDRAMSAALADDRLTARPGGKEGAYRIVPIEDLDAPDEVKTRLRNEASSSKGAVIRVPTGTIPSEAELLATLPVAQRSSAVLRQRLPNPPTTLQGTLLANAEVIGMEPSGALDGVRSSGLTRYFRVKGLGIVALNEENFRASGMVIEVFAESVNAMINGSPAQIELQEDGHGRARATLAWALDGKAFSLTATGEGDPAKMGRTLQDIASVIAD